LYTNLLEERGINVGGRVKSRLAAAVGVDPRDLLAPSVLFPKFACRSPLSRVAYAIHQARQCRMLTRTMNVRHGVKGGKLSDEARTLLRRKA
jgi:hypothetical protein